MADDAEDLGDEFIVLDEVHEDEEDGEYIVMDEVGDESEKNNVHVTNEPEKSSAAVCNEKMKACDTVINSDGGNTNEGNEVNVLHGDSDTVRSDDEDMPSDREENEEIIAPFNTFANDVKETRKKGRYRTKRAGRGVQMYIDKIRRYEAIKTIQNMCNNEAESIPEPETLNAKTSEDVGNKHKASEIKRTNGEDENSQNNSTSWTSLSYEELVEKKYEVMKNMVTSMRDGIFSVHPELKECDSNFSIELLPVQTVPLLKEYRSKCTFSIGIDKETNKQILGYCQCCTPTRKENIITHCSYCSNELPRSFNEVRKLFEEIILQDSSLGSMLWDKVTLRTCQSGELMIVVKMKPHNATSVLDNAKKIITEFFFERKDLQHLKVASLFFVKQGRMNTLEQLMGKDCLKETICGKKFNVSPKSMFEICAPAAETFCTVLKSCVQPTNGTLLLCIGAAADIWGLMLADHCKQVLSYNPGEEATKETRINARENCILNCRIFNLGFHLETVIKHLKEMAYDNLVVLHCPSKYSPAISRIRALPTLNRIVCIVPDPLMAKNITMDMCQQIAGQCETDAFLPVKVVPVDVYPLSPLCEMLVCFERMTIGGKLSSRSSQKSFLQQSLNDQSPSVVPPTRSLKDTGNTNVEAVPEISKKVQTTLQKQAKNKNVNLVHPVREEDQIVHTLMQLFDHEIQKCRTGIDNKFRTLFPNAKQVDWNETLSGELNFAANSVYTQLVSKYPLLDRGRRRQEELFRRIQQPIRDAESIEGRYGNESKHTAQQTSSRTVAGIDQGKNQEEEACRRPSQSAEETQSEVLPEKVTEHLEKLIDERLKKYLGESAVATDLGASPKLPDLRVTLTAKRSRVPSEERLEISRRSSSSLSDDIYGKRYMEPHRSNESLYDHSRSAPERQTFNVFLDNQLQSRRSLSADKEDDYNYPNTVRSSGVCLRSSRSPVRWDNSNAYSRQNW